MTTEGGCTSKIVKIAKNEVFLLNKVQKMTKQNFFFIKSKMLTIYDFHIDFQFRAHRSLPRDYRHSGAPPGTWNGSSPQWFEAKIDFSIPGPSFWVIATVDIC